MSDILYTIQHHHTILYRVAKFNDGDVQPEDVYDVTIYPTGRVHCGCLGFLRQKAPPEEHKHVKLVQRFIEDGEPMGAQYSLDKFNNPVREADLPILGDNDA